MSPVGNTGAPPKSRLPSTSADRTGAYSEQSLRRLHSSHVVIFATQHLAPRADTARMPAPRLSATSAYLVAAWPALGLALLVVDGDAMLLDERGLLVRRVPVGRA